MSGLVAAVKANPLTFNAAAGIIAVVAMWGIYLAREDGRAAAEHEQRMRFLRVDLDDVKPDPGCACDAKTDAGVDAADQHL